MCSPEPGSRKKGVHSLLGSVFRHAQNRTCGARLYKGSRHTFAPAVGATDAGANAICPNSLRKKLTTGSVNANCLVTFKEEL
jgi:hypothetical protein